MKTEKLYQNKEWLRGKYIEENLSTIKIGKLCEVTGTTIGNWLRKFNIKCTYNIPEDTRYRNKNWLENEYMDKKLSTVQIGKICNVDNKVIHKWLKRYDIPLRSTGEGHHIRSCNHCELSKKAFEWINGELLGDGCLQASSNYSAVFKYGSKYLEYARYVSDTLQSFGIKQSGKINKRHNKKYDSYSYEYCSLSYKELFDLYRKWYPKDKKIVLKDIKLTSLTCRQWLIGDGSLTHQKGTRPYIRLCTTGFIASDVKWLVEKLKRMSFKTTRQPANNIINISTHSTKEFLDYIGSSPTKCYQYKFEY